MSSNECAALAELHNALEPAGGILPKWTTTPPPGGFVAGSCCDWQWTFGAMTNFTTLGVWCDPSRRTVTYLRLAALPTQGYGLRGTIAPDAITKLTGLRGIELGWNQMTGTIPPELGSLSSLTVINLQYNSISGVLPSEIASLKSLRTLAIDNSKLTGLPSNFGSLSGLLYCMLEGVQDTCRPDPYPTACEVSSNLPINTFSPCAPLTATTTVLGTGTETGVISVFESFTTRTLMNGPTGSGSAQYPDGTSSRAREQRYTVFGSLFGAIVTSIITLLIFRRRIHTRSHVDQRQRPGRREYPRWHTDRIRVEGLTPTIALKCLLLCSLWGIIVRKWFKPDEYYNMMYTRLYFITSSIKYKRQIEAIHWQVVNSIGNILDLINL